MTYITYSKYLFVPPQIGVMVCRKCNKDIFAAKTIKTIFAYEGVKFWIEMHLQKLARKVWGPKQKHDCHFCNYRVVSPCKSSADTKQCENY